MDRVSQKNLQKSIHGCLGELFQKATTGYAIQPFFCGGLCTDALFLYKVVWEVFSVSVHRAGRLEIEQKLQLTWGSNSSFAGKGSQAQKLSGTAKQAKDKLEKFAWQWVCFSSPEMEDRHLEEIMFWFTRALFCQVQRDPPTFFVRPKQEIPCWDNDLMKGIVPRCVWLQQGLFVGSEFFLLQVQKSDMGCSKVKQQDFLKVGEVKLVVPQGFLQTEKIGWDCSVKADVVLTFFYCFGKNREECVSCKIHVWLKGARPTSFWGARCWSQFFLIDILSKSSTLKPPKKFLCFHLQSTWDYVFLSKIRPYIDIVAQAFHTKGIVGSRSGASPWQVAKIFSYSDVPVSRLVRHQLERYLSLIAKWGNPCPNLSVFKDLKVKADSSERKFYPLHL